MKKTERIRRKKWLFPVAVGVIVLVLLVVGVYLYKTSVRRLDLQRLQAENYQGLFLSTFPTAYYAEEDFLTYRGISVVKAQYTIKKADELVAYFDTLWGTQNQITNVYLGIDPYAFWQETGGRPEKWEALLELDLIRYVQEHQDVTFELLLPYEPLQQWTALTEAACEEKYDCYLGFINKLGAYPNVKLFFVGNEEWLIANTGNFTEGQVNRETAKDLFLSCFCDGKYMVTPESAGQMLGELSVLVKKEREMPSLYADLSEYVFVFFGDSILATARGSYSIPGVVSALTGAQCYNLAVGGTPAAVTEHTVFSFPYMAEVFLTGETSALEVNSEFVLGLESYQSGETEGRKHVFVLNYGLNDYFSGQPVSSEDAPEETTYGGAMRQGIAMLREAYPEAEIIVQTPTYTSEFSGGTEVLCADGTERVLQDYVKEAMAVAAELGVVCLDNYYDFGMDGSNYEIYLSDGTHPNNYGRYILGKRLAQLW